ncbi:phage protein NinX family protein, partial [Pantoea agglomerans]
MNYAEMSDFEVNKAVAVALGGVATTDYRGLAIYDMGESQPLVVSQCMHSKGDFLPCNSWADAGPII